MKIGLTNCISFCILLSFIAAGKHSSAALRFINDQIEGFTKYDKIVGETAEFDCKTEGMPQPSVRWTKYGQPLEEICYRAQDSQPSYSWELKLKELLLADAGNYSCNVTSGNHTLTRAFMLFVRGRKELKKPLIKDTKSQNITVTVGTKVRLMCEAEAQFKDTAPYIKWEKHTTILLRKNETNSTNVDNALGKVASAMRISSYNAEEIKRKFTGGVFTIFEHGDIIKVIETKKLERTFECEYVLDQVNMEDDAEYSCVAFNEIGFSKVNHILRVIPAPKPSRFQLAMLYAAKYGNDNALPDLPLSVTVAFPVFLLVVLAIGFIWWKEHVKRKLEEEKISLINIKKLRELDNFSSLDHMDKFSSKLEHKRSSYTSDGELMSASMLEHDDFSIEDQESQHLIGNGNPLIHATEAKSKGNAHKQPEMIPLRDIEAVAAETPDTGRRSEMESQSDLEWEPVDLGLDVSMSSKKAEISV